MVAISVWNFKEFCFCDFFLAWVDLSHLIGMSVLSIVPQKKSKILFPEKKQQKPILFLKQKSIKQKNDIPNRASEYIAY